MLTMRPNWRDHGAHGRLRQEERGRQVDRQVLLPVLSRDIGVALLGDGAGVVDEVVELTVLVHDLVDEAPTGLRVADVHPV